MYKISKAKYLFEKLAKTRLNKIVETPSLLNEYLRLNKINEVLAKNVDKNIKSVEQKKLIYKHIMK